jgi:hypothetical protein
MEAQRFANDYDGIVAGDPLAYCTHHHVGGNLWVVWQMFNSPASTVLLMKIRCSATPSTLIAMLLMVSSMAS